MSNLVIYYSRRGQNYVNGSIRNIEKGNAEIITEFIRNAVDADIFEVDTVKPYDKDYMVCIEEAKAELRAKARPKLKKCLAIFPGTTTSLLSVPTGGESIRWQCIPNSKPLTLRARPCIMLLRMKVPVLAAFPRR